MRSILNTSCDQLRELQQTHRRDLEKKEEQQTVLNNQKEVTQKQKQKEESEPVGWNHNCEKFDVKEVEEVGAEQGDKRMEHLQNQLESTREKVSLVNQQLTDASNKVVLLNQQLTVASGVYTHEHTQVVSQQLQLASTRAMKIADMMGHAVTDVGSRLSDIADKIRDAEVRYCAAIQVAREELVASTQSLSALLTETQEVSLQSVASIHTEDGSEQIHSNSVVGERQESEQIDAEKAVGVREEDVEKRDTNSLVRVQGEGEGEEKLVEVGEDVVGVGEEEKLVEVREDERKPSQCADSADIGGIEEQEEEEEEEIEDESKQEDDSWVTIE